MTLYIQSNLQSAISGLKDRLIVGQTISGPSLGIQVLDELRQRQITQDLKHFGGLRSFIREYLSDFLQIHEESDTYTVRGEDDQVPGWATVDGSSRLFWDLFNNPRRQGKFALVNSTLIATGGDQPVPPGAITISPMSNADYLDIATKFSALQQNPKEFEPVLSTSSEETFFSAWTELLRSIGPEAVKEWETHRVQNVLTTFSERLRDAGAEGGLIDQHSSELDKSQQKARAQTKAKAARALSESDSNVEAQPTTTSFREILRYASENLSEEEIRKISIPIGLVVDAIAKS